MKINTFIYKRPFLLLPFGITLLSFALLFTYGIFYPKVTRYTKLSPSMMVVEYSEGILKDPKPVELTKGMKISGVFTAKENNLGIILVRFFNYNRINSDIISFRIKDKYNKNWVYENTFKVDQFQPDEYFTFGFEPIRNSRLYIYQFEIESKAGKKNNAIALSKYPPNIALVYKVTKNDLLKDRSLILRFLYQKIIYSVSHLDYKLISITFIVSMSVSILWILKYKTYETAQKAIIFISEVIEEISKYIIKQITRSHHIPSRLKKRYISYLFGVSTGTIFIVSFVMRYSYYLKPENFSHIFYSQIGGGGDYDYLIRHSMRYVLYDDFLTYYWSHINDYSINLRVNAFFLNLFGFVKGLDYMEYFYIFLSSLVCLIPFLLLSRKKFSIGGFMASLLLAVNPTAVWLATGRPLDTLTSFFSSLFIIFFIISLKNKKYHILSLLGIIAFIDILNRPLMLLNNLPALVFFTVYYLYSEKVFIRRFPFIKFTYSKFTRAFTPLIIFFFFYITWCIYYAITFKIAWVMSPQLLLSQWNPVNYSGRLIGNVSVSPFEKIFRYFLLFNLAIEPIISYLHIHIKILSAMMIFMLLAVKELSKKALLWLIVPVLYTGLLILIQHILTTKMSDFDKSILAYRYFSSLTNDSFLMLYLFLSLIVLWVFLLKNVFFNYTLPIIIYIFILGYGFMVVFSQRHYIQLLIPLFILFGLTIDRLIQIFSSRRIFTAFNFFIVLLTIIVINVFVINIQETVNAFNNIRRIENDKHYLIEVRKIIPKDGIILVGMKGENPILISTYASRSIIFNINYSSPLFIPADEKYFRIPITMDRPGTRYSIKDESKSDINFREIVYYKNIFDKYKLYILDYDIPSWEIVLNKKESHPYIPIDTYQLKTITKTDKGRSVFQLVRKDEMN